jgi:hypothetical protein
VKDGVPRQHIIEALGRLPSSFTLTGTRTVGTCSVIGRTLV